MFVALETQWSVGRDGEKVGIRYESIQPVMEMMGIGRASWGDIFASVRIMEAEARRAWKVCK